MKTSVKWRVASGTSWLLRPVLVLVVAALSTSVIVVSAWGSVSTSLVSDMGSYGGYEFRNQASLKNTGIDGAATHTSVLAGTVPAGWLGAEGRLFRASDGALCGTSGMKYSPTAMSTFLALKEYWVIACPAGYYYSSGAAARWNGNGYVTQYTFRTANLYFS